MIPDSTRREFLHTASLAGTAALAGMFSQLPRVTAQEARSASAGVAGVDDSIEPLVKLIEETPRERLLEAVAQRIQSGTSYREVLAALLLAGVRNVQPYPAVGFKFHAVLVVNSCYLASLNGPDRDRWLPIFWALDYFKSSQADEAKSTGWRLPPVNESRIPDTIAARAEFIAALDHWDVERADTATAGIVRQLPATEVFQLFANYAARDFRSIGHKVIYLANAWRTLQVIGWQYAEPVCRSLTLAFLNHRGDPNPADSDLPADRAWRKTAELAAQLPANWLNGQPDAGLCREILAAGRGQTPEEIVATGAQLLTRGGAPQSVWDGIFLGAGELLMRQPGIVGLHGLTSANALHYVWRSVGDDALRRRLLLQGCAFNAYFREAARGRGALRDLTLDTLKPSAPGNSGNAGITEILNEVRGKPLDAAAKVRGYIEQGDNADALIAAARRLIFLKGRDAHDYKFSEAVLEDFYHVSPQHRGEFLATAVFHLKGTQDPNSGLIDRTRAALG